MKSLRKLFPLLLTQPWL